MRESLLPAVVFVEIVQQAQVLICCVFQSQTKESVLEVTFLRKTGCVFSHKPLICCVFQSQTKRSVYQVTFSQNNSCVFQSQTINRCVFQSQTEKCVDSHIITK